MGTRVLSVLLAAAAAGSHTTSPVEHSEFMELTTHEEVCEYVLSFQEAGIAAVETVGISERGRAILLLRFAAAGQEGEKPAVLMVCQQHGNEPSGKEAALLLAHHLAESPDLLERIELLLVPQANPDGAHARIRDNGAGIDLNRDHVILRSPETRALHRLFLREMPHVTLDVHEYYPFSRSWIASGMVKDSDVMIGEATNPNIEAPLLALAGDMVDRAGRRIEAAGYSFSRYVVGSPEEGSRLRYSTTDINDGRNSFGIYGTLSFIQEGKRYGDGAENLELRARSQLAGMLAMLEVVAHEPDRVIEAVLRARERILGGEVGLVHLQYDYFPDEFRATVTLPIFDLLEWRRVPRDLPGFQPLVKPKRSVETPEAYLIDPGHDRLIDVLGRHGIQMGPAHDAMAGLVEEYLIVNVTPMEEEELTVHNVDAHARPASVPIPPGMTMVRLDQPAGLLLPLLLEPESTRGLMSEYAAGEEHFGHYLRPGNVFPVRRLLRR